MFWGQPLCEGYFRFLCRVSFHLSYLTENPKDPDCIVSCLLIFIIIMHIIIYLIVLILCTTLIVKLHIGI